MPHARAAPELEHRLPFGCLPHAYTPALGPVDDDGSLRRRGALLFLGRRLPLARHHETRRVVRHVHLVKPFESLVDDVVVARARGDLVRGVVAQKLRTLSYPVIVQRPPQSGAASTS